MFRSPSLAAALMTGSMRPTFLPPCGTAPLPGVWVLFLIAAALLPAPLEAQGISRDQVVWTAGALQKVLTDRDYPAVLAVSALNRGGGLQREGLDVLFGALAPGTVGNALSRCRGARDPVEGTLCSLETLVPLLPPGLARDVSEEGARLVALYHTPGGPAFPGSGPGEVRRAGGEGVLLAPLQRFAEQAFEEAWDRRGEGTPDAGADVVGLLGSALGLSPAQGADELLATLPALRALAERHPTLVSLGGAAGQGEAVLAEYREFLGSVVGAPGQLLTDAAGLEARSIQEWAAQRSFVYLSSRTAALAGLEGSVTDRIRSLGNAAADIQREGTAFLANRAGLGQQVAMAALRGDVFTLAAGVASFFQLTPGAFGPGAAQEVRALREGIDAMRVEMEEGFGVVDARFDEVMEVLDARMGRMETLVAAQHTAVRNDLFALEVGLQALGQRVDRMESTLTSYMQAGFDREFSRTLIRCLEHRERLLPPHDEMAFPVFSECLTEFRVRGVQDARDPLLSDRSTPVDDLSLVSALADSSTENLGRRLPLLARAADQRFGYGGMLEGRGGGNPEEWMVAAHAYLTMLQDWPEHASGVAPGDLQALLATGEELQSILRGVVDSPGETRGRLLHQVLSHYRERVAELTAEADILARRHQQARLRRVDADSVLTRVVPMEPDRPTLTSPVQVSRTVPHEVRTAIVLALEEPTLAYRTRTQVRSERTNFRRSGLFRRMRHDRLTWARTELEVELRLGNGRVVTRNTLSGPEVLTRREEMGGGEGSEKVRGVQEPVPDPEAHFLAEVWPTLSEDARAWSFTPPAPETLQQVEVDIEAELRRNESASLNAVFGTVCRDEGTAPGVEGDDRESATRIRRAMDGLSAARALLAAYTRLGLPHLALADPLARELLHGPDGLLDREALCRTIRAGESPLRVVWLDEEPRRRADDLSILLASALVDETLAPSPPGPVDNTVDQLRAALRIQQLRARIARDGG